MSSSKKALGGSGRKQGNSSTDLVGTTRRSPDGTFLAVMWPSPPSPHTWAVMDAHGSCGYEKPDRVAHWPVIGAVPGSPAAGMELVKPGQGSKAVQSKAPVAPRVVDAHRPELQEAGR